MKKNMNCVFCQRECIEIVEKYIRKNPVKWKCNNHPFSVVYWKYTGKDRKYNLRYDFYVKHNGKTYKFYFQVEDSPSMQIIPGTREYFCINWTYKCIVQFAYLPNITPENAMQKLSTILLFS